MMATVPHIISGLGVRKFQADGFLLTRVYKSSFYVTHRTVTHLVITPTRKDVDWGDARANLLFSHH